MVQKSKYLPSHRANKSALPQFPACVPAFDGDMQIAREAARQAVVNRSHHGFMTANLLMLWSRKPAEGCSEYEVGRFNAAMETRDQLRIRVAMRKPLAPEVIAKRIYDRVMSRKVAVE
ncbi:MAG: hypothetical protein [Bacteriophage sp.]|nr:MAG: hypothetical protein [Bacteriophage sp.]